MENYNRVKKYDWGTCYYLDNKIHRLDGPACEFVNGDKSWLQNNLLHRINGPAIEYICGEQYWYYKGKKIDCSSQKEFERYIKLKLFW